MKCYIRTIKVCLPICLIFPPILIPILKFYTNNNTSSGIWRPKGSPFRYRWRDNSSGRLPACISTSSKIPYSSWKTWDYGTPTKNQRIERSWRTLVDQPTNQWIAYFDHLKRNGLFDGSKFDRIALQFIYMDKIRDRINSFVQMHNTHPIRKQVQQNVRVSSFLYNCFCKYVLTLLSYLWESLTSYTTTQKVVPAITLLLQIQILLDWESAVLVWWHHLPTSSDEITLWRPRPSDWNSVWL